MFMETGMVEVPASPSYVVFEAPLYGWIKLMEAQVEVERAMYLGQDYPFLWASRMERLMAFDVIIQLTAKDWRQCAAAMVSAD